LGALVLDLIFVRVFILVLVVLLLMPGVPEGGARGRITGDETLVFLEPRVDVVEQTDVGAIVPSDSTGQAFDAMDLEGVLDVEVELGEAVHGLASGNTIGERDGAHLGNGILQVNEGIVTG